MKGAHERCAHVITDHVVEYHEDICYQFVPIESYWTDAENFCQSVSGWAM